MLWLADSVKLNNKLFIKDTKKKTNYQVIINIYKLINVILFVFCDFGQIYSSHAVHGRKQFEGLAGDTMA
jgi:hypothetical protein